MRFKTDTPVTGSRLYQFAVRWITLASLSSALALGVLAHAAEAPPTVAKAQSTTPLRDLVKEALQNSPEIRAARKEQEAASQRIAPAGALDDPMLEAGIINLPTSSFRFDREDMTMKMIGLSQRFPYPGKRGLRQDVAAREAESSGYGYQETLNRVVREIRTAYYDL